MSCVSLPLGFPPCLQSESTFSRKRLVAECFRAASVPRRCIIDWDSLLSALKSGRLAGAALDVFEGEFLPGFENTLPGHPVLEYARTHDNLILTPHIGGSTVDAWRLTESYAIDMALAAIGNIR